MQLHDILAAAGFLIWLIGMAAMDSDLIFIPVSMVIVGMGLLVWSAYESGYLRKGVRGK